MRSRVVWEPGTRVENCNLVSPFPYNNHESAMNRKSHRVYLLLAATVVTTACYVGERRQETITRNWPASGIRRVEVQEQNSSVSIAGGDASSISLVADVRTRGFEPKAQAENKGYFTTEIKGDTLVIGRSGKKRVRFPFHKREVQVAYTIKVPESMILAIRTVNGRIQIEGVSGQTSATTVNGHIELEAPGSSAVSAKTVNGHVRVRFRDGFQGAQLKTVNGSVRAVLPASASFFCDLSQVNGDFEASFPLSIHSHPGSRRVSGTVNGGQHPLKITTVNGDVEVERGGAAVPPTPAIPPTPPVPPAPLSGVI